MRKIGILLIFAVFMSMNNSCIIELVENDGQVIFWSDFDGPVIDVYFEGVYKGSIYDINSSAPDCGTGDNVTLTLAPGTYTNWHAMEDASPYREWNMDHSYSITITSDGCYTMRLYASSKGETMIDGGINSDIESKVIGTKK